MCDFTPHRRVCGLGVWAGWVAGVTVVWSGQETPDNYAGLLKLGDWCILLPMQFNAMVVEHMFFLCL